MKKEISFSVGCAVIFLAAFFAFEIILAGKQGEADALATMPVPPVANAPQETAIAAAAIAPATAEAPADSAPGLLPNVTLLPSKPANTTVIKKKFVAAATVTPPPKPTASAAPTNITAITLLNAATLSTKELPSGPYKVSFSANLGANTSLTWGPDAATVGGSGAVPAFAATFTCDPQPSGLLFAVSTNYTCMLALTPLTGSDKRTQSKSFSFTTGSGQLVVTLPLSMGSVLQNTETDGGFVFNNQDAAPVTVTGLTLTVSYTALTTAYGPLTLRIIDPVTDTALGNYDLGSLPADASLPYTHTGTVAIPLSFAVKALTQRMLPLALLGVQTMDISNVNPSMTITLTAMTTDPQSSKMVLAAAKIAWSCIVPIGAYDPNATSGPFATGQACK